MATTKTSAIDVAKYLVWLADSEDEPDRLTPMRIQKLLYYCQGWSLVRRDRPAFYERIQAWAHGPVVPEVFQEFKSYGRDAIPANQGDCKAVSEGDAAFVNGVWAVYKPYSAISLSQMTHDERPWKDARGNLPREASCKKEITTKALRLFFSDLAKKR